MNDAEKRIWYEAVYVAGDLANNRSIITTNTEYNIGVGEYPGIIGDD